MNPGITGIIHTRNEERNIAQAIRSLDGLADEVLVADMHSTDRTVEIAESLGARVIQVPEFGYVEPARPIALEAAEHDWIITIDADEIVPPPLVARLRDISRTADVDVVETSRLTFILGEPMNGTGWGLASERHFRFFRRGSLLLAEGIHDVPRVAEQAVIERLPATPELAIWHFNYTDWAHFLGKLNRYTTIEAESMLARGERPSRGRMVRQVFHELLRRFFRRNALGDGYRGAVLTVLMMLYRIMSYAKARQIMEVGREDDILARYAAVADRVSKGDLSLG